MTEEQILQAFNNRWRIKGFDDFEVRQLSGREVRKLCLDFFRTGIILASDTVVSGSSADTPAITPHPSEDTSFTTWWDMYGKKIDRAKCERKWNKLTLAERQACLAATPAYVASTPDLQYRRHPATYLNNKSWENQIIPHNNATDKQAQQQHRVTVVANRIAELAKNIK
jgi:hypothetical protein